jgi:glycosyltransferase involved in cell wall biosynthesis
VTDVERDTTILVKTFERPDTLRRLTASIRRFYPRIPILVVDDSAEALDPPPEGVSRYLHLPQQVGLAEGRNIGLLEVDTEYVVVCDDDMVFGRKTDLRKMLATIEGTRFDLVACRWMDHDPWRSIRLGHKRFEGSVEIVDSRLVRGLGAARGRMDGLAVYDMVPNFFITRVDTLGESPWDADLNFMEHVEFFMTLKERGLLCTMLDDVVVYHYPELPRDYYEVRTKRAPYLELWAAKRGFHGDKIFVGRWFTRRDRLVHYVPSAAVYGARRTVRLVRSGSLPRRRRGSRTERAAGP